MHLSVQPEGGSTNVYSLLAFEADVPPGFVTDTFTVPAVCAGAVAVIWVSLSIVNDVAALAPKSTVAASVNPVPVKVTVFPPATGPEAGSTLVTVGASGTGTVVVVVVGASVVVVVGASVVVVVG